MNELIGACDEVLRCWVHGDAAALPNAMTALQVARNAAHTALPVVGQHIQSSDVIESEERRA